MAADKGWDIMVENYNYVDFSGNHAGDFGATSGGGNGGGGSWSDGLHDEYTNFMLMGSRRYDNLYGTGASEIARGLSSNPALQSQWRQGMISIEKVRANGGYYTQLGFIVNLKTPESIIVDGKVITMSTAVNAGMISQHWVAVNSPSSQGGNVDAAANIVGAAEFYYSLGVDANPKASGGAKGFGMGLTGLSTILGGLQVYDQYTEGGIKNVRPADATNVAIGSVGLATKVLSWYGIGGKIVSCTGELAGGIGMALTIYQLWGNIYEPMNDLRYAPSYILPDGEPVYGNPVSGDEW
jgi:hypothetical protein